VRKQDIVRCAHCDVFQHSKRNFVSPYGHVICSMYYLQSLFGSPLNASCCVTTCYKCERHYVTVQVFQALWKPLTFLFMPVSCVAQFNAKCQSVSCVPECNYSLWQLEMWKGNSIRTTYFDPFMCYLCFRDVLGSLQSDFSEFLFDFIPSKYHWGVSQWLLWNITDP